MANEDVFPTIKVGMCHGRMCVRIYVAVCGRGLCGCTNNITFPNRTPSPGDYRQYAIPTTHIIYADRDRKFHNDRLRWHQEDMCEDDDYDLFGEPLPKPTYHKEGYCGSNIFTIVVSIFRTSCAKRIQRWFRKYLDAKKDKEVKAITLQSWWVAISYRTGGASWEDVERQFEKGGKVNYKGVIWLNGY